MIQALPEYNFSDDGNKFTFWVYKGIPMSQTTYGSDVFICLRHDYIEQLFKDGKTDIRFDVPYNYIPDDFRKLSDKYNGVKKTSFDAKEFIADVEEFRRRAIELQNQFDKVNVNEEEFYAQVDKEVKYTENIISEFRKNFDWVNASDYQIKECKEAVKSLEREIAKAKSKNFSKSIIFDKLAFYYKSGYCLIDTRDESEKLPFISSYQVGNYYLRILRKNITK